MKHDFFHSCHDKVQDCVDLYMALFRVVSMVTILVVSMVTVEYILSVFSLVTLSD